MPTKKKTKSTAEQRRVFDPQSMDLFHGLQGMAGPILQDYMRDPDKSTYALLRVLQGQRAIGSAFQAGNRTMLQNFLASGSGMGGIAQNALLQANLGRSSRAYSGASAQNQIQNRLAAEARRSMAVGQALSYQPLETGQTSKSQSVESTSGLGTWLPQVLGGVLSAVTGGLGGGLLGMLGGGGGGMMPGNYGGNALQMLPLSAYRGPQAPAQNPYLGYPSGSGVGW